MSSIRERAAVIQRDELWEKWNTRYAPCKNNINCACALVTRFKLPKKVTHCTSLLIDGEVIRDPEKVLQAWSNHFRQLSSFHEDDFPVLDQYKRLVEEMSRQSKTNDDNEMILDVPFTLEEVDGAVRGLKLGKSGGYDHLQPEHLRHGGKLLIVWLQQVSNTIIEKEIVPDSFKLGVVSPVYKGNGKDPLDANSYRGITLATVLAKTLEKLILLRLQPTLLEQGLPHRNQTGFVKNNSCVDAIFSTYEAASRFARMGDNVYLGFFDLQKAFDSVQYSVLLSRAYESGIKGKTWRIIKSWYTDPQCVVKLNGKFSESYTMERGVLQGSVLSPTLFLLVMNPLLKKLEENQLGPRVSGLYAGCFAHADDIRTLSTSRDTLDKQITAVEEFVSSNALSLNPSKCEVVVVSSMKVPASPICAVAEEQLCPSESAKCLGYWWSWDLSADKAIDEAIARARRTFFAYGAKGAFQGQLNPLSGRAIFESCVLPVLMYGSENWYVTDSLMAKLEAFQEEIGRRILRLPRHHSGRGVRLALEWPSMVARVLQRKVLYLLRAFNSEESLGHLFLTRLTKDLSNVIPLQLVQGIQLLESQLGMKGLVDRATTESCSAVELKKEILKKDREKLMATCLEHRSTKNAAKIATYTSWLKLWDRALDSGPVGSEAMQNLYREMTRPLFGPNPCPRCSEVSLENTLSYFEHYVTEHLKITTSLTSVDEISSLLTSQDPDLTPIIKLFKIV